VIEQPPPPRIQEIVPTPDPEEVFLRLGRLPHCLFLDSALGDPVLGRYSFATADPFDYFEVPADGSDALSRLRRRMSGWKATSMPGLPPFQGGAAGLLSYDLGRSLESLARPEYDEFQVPAVAVGLYDVVVAWDHVEGRAWLISQGLPETQPRRRARRAQDRMSQFNDWLQQPSTPTASPPHRAESAPLPLSQLAPQHSISGPPGLTSNFSADGYLRAVQRVIDYILDGDVFQVNLAQRLLYPAHGETVELYRRLRRRNPAPMAGYFDLGSFQIASASPERFLKVSAGQVETRPIKGTRPRRGSAEADRQAADELRHSPKDVAENVMIVDLLRNDLARVCLPDSVQVSELCQVETYQHVLHLVSAVRGRLRPGLSGLELVRAAFPGGSVTGAPKVRAMEIITELEPTARGAYCGSLGYLGFDGTMDLSILIRTIIAGRGWWQLPVGGGIVAESVPQAEYEETWHKAEGLVRSLV